ncbi:MAG: hypothetical protein LBQ98_01675, partial [Nitrososphaerota archaeon]|nr:hypothetical protein [Nitrososphaerota archaeon]
MSANAPYLKVAVFTCEYSSVNYFVKVAPLGICKPFCSSVAYQLCTPPVVCLFDSKDSYLAASTLLVGFSILISLRPSSLVNYVFPASTY